MVECKCGRTAEDDGTLDVWGWVYSPKGYWTCPDCAVERYIEAMEVA